MDKLFNIYLILNWVGGAGCFSFGLFPPSSHSATAKKLSAKRKTVLCTEYGLNHLARLGNSGMSEHCDRLC